MGADADSLRDAHEVRRTLTISRRTMVNVSVSFVASAYATTLFLAFGPLLKDFVEGFSVSAGTASTVYLTQWLAFAAMSLLLGVFSDRWGINRSIRLGFFAILAGLALTVVSFRFVTYVLGFGLLVGAGLSAAYGPMQNLIMSTTRGRTRGTALGIITAAHGIGPFLLLPVIATVAARLGIQGVMRMLFAGALVVMATTLLLREDTDRSLVAGDEEQETTEGSNRQTHNSDRALPPGGGQAAKLGLAPNSQAGRRADAKMTAAHLLGCASHTIPLVYLVDYLASSGGVGPVRAAIVLSVVSLASTVSRLLAPALGARLGGLRILIVTLPLQLVGIMLFNVFAGMSIWLLHLAAVIFGLGFGSEMILFSLIARQLFAGKIGRALGTQLLGAGVGMGGGAFGAGMLLSHGASYADLFWLAAALGILGEGVAYTLPRVVEGVRPEPETQRVG